VVDAVLDFANVVNAAILHRARTGGRQRGRHRSATIGASDWTTLLTLSITPPVAGPPPRLAQVAQLVEHATENRSVGGSIPPLGTNTLDRERCVVPLKRETAVAGHIVASEQADRNASEDSTMASAHSVVDVYLG
jgi:hypothetical protein